MSDCGLCLTVVDYVWLWFMSDCGWLCFCRCLSACVSVFIRVRVSVFIRVSECDVWLSACPSVMSDCPRVRGWLTVHPRVRGWLTVHPRVRVSDCLSVSVSECLTVRLSDFHDFWWFSENSWKLTKVDDFPRIPEKWLKLTKCTTRRCTRVPTIVRTVAHHPLPGYHVHHYCAQYCSHTGYMLYIGVSQRLLCVHQASFGYKEYSENMLISEPSKTLKKHRN